jgi:hypothetical protein
MNLIKLSGDRIINLDRINQVQFFADTEVCQIEWATGDAPLCLHGGSAIAFIAALEDLCLVDVGRYEFIERDDDFFVGNEYDLVE